MQDLLNDLNHAIITEELLEEDRNIELLEQAIYNWQELIAQIKRERKRDIQMARRWEMDTVTMAEFGLKI